MTFTLRLPWPPSVNGMYVRTRRGGLRLSDRAATYRAVVRGIMALARVRPLEGPASVTVDLFPPKGRSPVDVDNPIKALLDAMQAGGAFRDDRAVERLLVTRRAPVAGGEVLVIVEKYRPELESPRTRSEVG